MNRIRVIVFEEFWLRFGRIVVGLRRIVVLWCRGVLVLKFAGIARRRVGSESRYADSKGF